MKFTNPWVDLRAQSVRTTRVQTYLLSRGWKRQSFPRPQVMLFTGPPDDDGEPIVQMVPADEQDRGAITSSASST